MKKLLLAAARLLAPLAAPSAAQAGYFGLLPCGSRCACRCCGCPCPRSYTAFTPPCCWCPCPYPVPYPMPWGGGYPNCAPSGGPGAYGLPNVAAPGGYGAGGYAVNPAVTDG